MNLENELRERAEAHGQGHVFSHWSALDQAGREGLLAQLAEVDFELLKRLTATLAEPGFDANGRSFDPPELFPLERDADQQERALAARATGAAELAAGRVGFLLVAGGQASRLGYDGPKGAFPLGPVTDRPLFAWHAARLLAAGRRHGFAPRWYVMTSQANDADTRAFFERHDHFGFPPEDVFFFSQAMLPALDLEGRILLSGPGQLFLAPNGHGGTLDALARSGALADATQRGITQFSYFQVDNPLVRPADELFLGLHVEAGARMSSKVVSKNDPGEKVGVLGRIDGSLGCIEYSDLPGELRDARDEAGQLLFRAGNIAVHAIAVEFVDELTRHGLELPWHVARKRMQVLGNDGAPTEVDGAKFETFVFDALSKSPTSVTLEVERALEFSPVKNASGGDSPDTSRRDLCRLFADWVSEVGHELPERQIEGSPALEVCPLVAEDLAEFQAAGPPEPLARDGGHVYAERS
ncbi:UTP--glucose-1-phosphate uridylyltransferase [Engelhardtia mirabilis]|uniref:Putative uridylyltransferase n=1 Tax=Engelhardtia mirabilis TaxID=2528011 RepID=A0A518BKN9_9BACT|nr:putative uridylyltransferase [Planctomycetes bacterium Pla133]QDV01862.1 putative uridylyltransferase [Planctomycetes bacterium Pla86]